MVQQSFAFSPSIAERFEAFDAANPRVYEAIVRLAFQLKNAGRQRLSMETIFGKIRWDMSLETTDSSGFKLNDHYSSRYTRKLIADYPEFDGFFEVRKLKS